MKLKNVHQCKIWSPTKELLDVDNLEKAVKECIDNNDLEGVKEVVDIYIQAVRNTQKIKKTKTKKKSVFDVWCDEFIESMKGKTGERS